MMKVFDTEVDKYDVKIYLEVCNISIFVADMIAVIYCYKPYNNTRVLIHQHMHYLRSRSQILSQKNEIDILLSSNS